MNETIEIKLMIKFTDLAKLMTEINELIPEEDVLLKNLTDAMCKMAMTFSQAMIDRNEI